MNPQQHFFQSFGIPGMSQQPIDTTPDYIKQNEAILEISNNWKHIKQLIKRGQSEETMQVDDLDKSWINFIVNNRINLDSFQDEKQFLQMYWLVPKI
jgi:hypothetical protein